MSMGKTWKAPKGRRAPPLVLERARSRPPVDVADLRRSMTDFIQKSVEGALQGTVGTPFRPTPPVTASKPFTFTDVLNAVSMLREYDAAPIGDPASYTMHLTPAQAEMVARADRQVRAGWCRGALPSTPMGWTSCLFEACQDEFMLRPVTAAQDGPERGFNEWRGVHTHTRPKPPPIHPDPPKQPPDGGDEAREELLALFGWCNGTGCPCRLSYESAIAHAARTIVFAWLKKPCTIVLPDDPHGDVAPCGYVYPQCTASLKA